MKYRFTLYIVLILAVGRLSAQTRYYSFSFSKLPVEASGVAEKIMKGTYGFKLSTHKFQNNKVMRGFSLAYQQLKYEESGTATYWNSSSDMIDLDYTYRLDVSKIAFTYEAIRLFGQKEFDDSWAIYGTSATLMAFNFAKETNTYSDPKYPYANDNVEGSLPYMPVDLGVKFGLGYQHSINLQWMAYTDIQGYISFLGSAGYEWNIGVRYRGLGKN